MALKEVNWIGIISLFPPLPPPPQAASKPTAINSTGLFREYISAVSSSIIARREALVRFLLAAFTVTAVSREVSVSRESRDPDSWAFQAIDLSIAIGE